jgi:hypothetical protein
MVAITITIAIAIGSAIAIAIPTDLKKLVVRGWPHPEKSCQPK